ncbi:uracil phosphoribosyltransferase [Pontibacter sp. G13]|uniref:uracil phosphoribosyltransferase n=1 Tax=Pontibacter sp. G13 TaxID=3074898 RepID=UPI0028893885|nr:uracil phosphoribosyltransferase [Pontibacter sp. G13]WNJ20915.1 uracil phosphoribosyltransferase [Pontibacter sp. G13]
MDSSVTILGNRLSYLNNILHELRDEEIQKDRLRFRFNLERMGEIMAYEISKHLSFTTQETTTPLGELEVKVLEQQPILVSVLRAGVPLHQGFLRMFDRADNGFISAYRHITRGNEFVIKIEYTSVPPITGRDLIMIDPMIATGRSLVEAYKQIQALGEPGNLFIAGAIASEEGIAYVRRNIPQSQVFIGAVDKELTAKSYIVPGLGDAGDLAYGPKH